ncbi:DUF3450 domain-containing protein [Saccharophagus degradans]|uniref:TonB system biopolymer transport component n=2 Tax=Saccharophagus degradans TaxID=86304 RepID=Q21NW3_SACD2|nr:DUF3450 domain-containing protein [Saccharophagus degradans]ABD79616.1 TonB system biopolymer transport component [Saccharophagus degradans 2-40]MBU2986355.1 DUF3450 domain-containing protein [Saccharophagus degradans]MDO6423426.1 DUF3450 domain-containing protein [Saccharophagus degradans]MDO6606831.1 DUF3450 domain-containing protein [Saccharophagus degradans]WGO98237.1 DUF3450 domain-containing protein [Saccharophagus degradans]
MKKQRMKAVALSTAISAGALFAGAAQADQLDAIFETSQSKLALAQASQKRIDKLQDDTDSLLNQFKTVSKQIEDLRVYNAQLDKQLANQRTVLNDLDESINNVTVIERRIQPLIMRMLDGLEQFIELDVPIYLDERRDRVAKIRANMERADITVSEKFRQVLEAYDIEAEYGRKLFVYTDTLSVGGQDLQVNILGVGRVALMYQTLDTKYSGAWDQSQRAWVELDSGEYRAAILKAIKIARKQATQDMIQLPILAPEAAQ